MVEWKKLGDVCNFQNGYAFKSGLFKEIGLPIIRITNISDRSVNLDDCKYFNFEDYKGVNLDDFIIRKGDILVAMSGATTGKIGFYNHSNISYLNQRVGKFIPHEEMLENRYLYHFLLSQYKVIYIMAGGGAQPNLSSNKLLNDLFIPIPSKSEQERIVSILDTFTSSISNLKEQIKERRKQYEYYRDRLLDLEGKDGVEMKAISQVATNYTGLTYKPSNVSETGTLVLRSSNINEDTLAFSDNVFVQMDIPQRAIVKENDILICVRNGSKRLVGKAAMITKEAEGMAFGAFMTILRANEINSKFLFYLWQSSKVKKQYKGDEAMPIAQITSRDFQRIIVSVPSKEEQLRIVSILDQFEASIANLEAQLKEREKQYEYYRNQLLTFE